MIFFISIFVLIAIVLAYSLITLPRLLGPISIMLSGIERFSVYIGLTVTPVLLASFFLLIETVFSKDMRDTWKREYAKKSFKIIMLILIGIIVSALISSIFSPYRFTSLKGAMYIVLFVTLILSEYILISHFRNTKVLFWSVALSILAFSLYALLQVSLFALGKYPDPINISIPHNNALSPLDFTRIIGTHTLLRPNSGFNDVNSAAGFLILYLPFLGYLVYTKGSGDKKLWIFSILAFLTGLVSFVFMSSRAGYSALIPMFLILYLYLALRIKKVRNILFALLTLVLVVSGIFSLTHTSSINNAFQSLYRSEYSTRAHIAYIQGAMDEFKIYPVLGGGIDSYDLFFEKQIETKQISYYGSVDNPPLYIKYLAEQGIVGLIVNLLLIFSVLIILMVAAVKAKMTDVSFLFLSVLLGFSALLWSNIFHAYFSLFFVAVFIGFALALVNIV